MMHPAAGTALFAAETVAWSEPGKATMPVAGGSLVDGVRPGSGGSWLPDSPVSQEVKDQALIVLCNITKDERPSTKGGRPVKSRSPTLYRAPVASREGEPGLRTGLAAWWDTGTPPATWQALARRAWPARMRHDAPRSMGLTCRLGWSDELL